MLVHMDLPASPCMDTRPPSSGWLACAYGLLLVVVASGHPPARAVANGNDKRRVWRVTRHSWAKLPDLG